MFKMWLLVMLPTFALTALGLLTMRRPEKNEERKPLGPPSGAPTPAGSTDDQPTD